MKFKIDDEVRVVADEKRLREYFIERTISGKTGTIVGIGIDGWHSSLHSYNVKGNNWVLFLPEDGLELVKPERTFVEHPDGGLEVKDTKAETTNNLIPVSHKDYMFLSDAYDAHSKNLMGLKGEEYAIDGDFLAMENRLAGMLGDTPEYVSLVMAGKHITALGIILLKNDPDEIKLAKLDERVRDATNLLKIMAAFVHAKQNDFSLHLGKEEKDNHNNIGSHGYCLDCEKKIAKAKHLDLVPICEKCTEVRGFSDFLVNKKTDCNKVELDYQAAVDHETGALETVPGYGGDVPRA